MTSLHIQSHKGQFVTPKGHLLKQQQRISGAKVKKCLKLTVKVKWPLYTLLPMWANNNNNKQRNSLSTLAIPFHRKLGKDLHLPWPWSTKVKVSLATLAFTAGLASCGFYLEGRSVEKRREAEGADHRSSWNNARANSCSSIFREREMLSQTPLQQPPKGMTRTTMVFFFFESTAVFSFFWHLTKRCHQPPLYRFGTKSRLTFWHQSQFSSLWLTADIRSSLFQSCWQRQDRVNSVKCHLKHVWLSSPAINMWCQTHFLPSSTRLYTQTRSCRDDGAWAKWKWKSAEDLHILFY